MAIITSKTRAANALDEVLASINEEGGSNGVGYIRIYTGSAPADLATGATGTLLAQCDLIDGSQAAFGATSTTTLIATGYTTGGEFAVEGAAVAANTAGYWRLFDYNGTAVMQGTIGTSGADLNLSTLSITLNAIITITSFTVEITGIT